MTIDYAYLRRLVANLEDPDENMRVAIRLELDKRAEDMARELLALRDGVKQVADDLGAEAEYAPNIPTQTAYLEAERLLTNLLEGDTE